MPEKLHFDLQFIETENEHFLLQLPFYHLGKYEISERKIGGVDGEIIHLVSPGTTTIRIPVVEIQDR